MTLIFYTLMNKDKIINLIINIVCCLIKLKHEVLSTTVLDDDITIFNE